MLKLKLPLPMFSVLLAVWYIFSLSPESHYFIFLEQFFYNDSLRFLEVPYVRYSSYGSLELPLFGQFQRLPDHKTTTTTQDEPKCPPRPTSLLKTRQTRNLRKKWKKKKKEVWHNPCPGASHLLPKIETGGKLQKWWLQTLDMEFRATKS